MFELGTGIAVAGVSISAAAVAITAIKARPNTNNGNGLAFNQKLCDEKHKALDDKFTGFERWMERVEDKLDRVLDR